MFYINNEAVYPSPFPPRFSLLLFKKFITGHQQRKPLRKEENGTSQAEYAMTSSENNKTVDVNNAVV